MATPLPQLYVLLVGINKYADPQISNLRGCENDVDKIEKLLIRQFNVPENNIDKLVNQHATHNAIKAAFRKHLTEKARAWKTAGSKEPKPAFYFHFSGHGSQTRDETGTEPDGMDETIVAHDSRLPGIYDIKDWELGELIDELSQYSDNVTIVLDCCHSGSGTRDYKENVSQTRRCAPDDRPQPLAQQRPANLQIKRNIGGSDWEIGSGQYVLLAGCRDREESNEHPVMEGSKRSWHGALTFFFLQTLAQMPVGQPLTYDQLYQRISREVNKAYPDQMPQCEGERGRLLFGGRGPQRDLFFHVVARPDEIDDGLIWIDGGLVHGLTPLSQLKVFSDQGRTSTEADEVLAILEIQECRAAESGCTVIEGTQKVAAGSVVAVHRLNLGNMQRTVLLDIGDEQLRSIVENRLATREEKVAADISDYVRVVSATTAAQFRIAAVDGNFQIQDNSERLLTAPYRPDQLEELAADLVRIVRYYNALELHNADAQSVLAGTIAVEMKELTSFDPVTGRPLTKALPRTIGGEVIAEVGMQIVWEIVNNSSQPLFFALLGFAADWEIYQLYPPREGAHDQLLPKQPFYYYGPQRKPIEAQLPKGFFGEAKDYFKVIATVKNADYSVLVQKPLVSPFTRRNLPASNVRGGPLSAFEQLLVKAMNGKVTRAYGSDEDTAIGDEWTTAEIEVLTVESADRVQHSLSDAEPAKFEAYQIRFEAPAGFVGQVRVLTATQGTRAADGELTDLQPPPGLALAEDWFQPLAIGTKRAVRTTAAYIELEAENTAYAVVTSDKPLIIHLDWDLGEDTTSVLALAYDGSFFYPVGRSREADKQSVAVEWLPEADAANVVPERSRRGAGRVLKLYLYKMMKWEEPSLGLHHIRWLSVDEAARVQRQEDEQDRSVIEGILRYSAIDKADFQAGERVAVIVHGFSSITTQIVYWVVGQLAQHGIRYDRVLAFDYETFNTAISTNGQKLANALRDLGFAENDGYTVDVFAHSMGALVARSMIEQWQGSRFANRCLFAGPPNLGTRLADAKVLVPWLSTLFLNGKWAGIPPAVLGRWVLGKIARDAVGIEDLRPSAQWLADLNGSNQPAEVVYFVLAGSNSKPEKMDASAWERLQRKIFRGANLALDVLLGEKNDMVVSVPSMLGVRNGNYPREKLKTAIISCTHDAYFRDEQAIQMVVEWLKTTVDKH